jgi:hypothetical protein
LVDVRPIGGAGAPKTIVKKASDELRKVRRSGNSFERNDEVWAAFDRDEHDDVLLCLNNCVQGGIEVAFSNPCIEQWAIIHFQNPVSDAPLTRHQAQSALEELMPNYKKSSSKIFDFNELKDRYEVAVANAKLLKGRREAEGDPHGAPVTTFHLLTERIRELGRAK